MYELGQGHLVNELLDSAREEDFDEYRSIANNFARNLWPVLKDL